MNRTLKSIAAGLGLTAMAIATSAQAVSIQDLFNDAVITSKTQASALVLSLSTEVYRSAQAGLKAIAACIEENFMPASNKGSQGDLAVWENIDRARDRTVGVGSYIERTIDSICSSGGDARGSTAPVMQPATTSVRDFYNEISPKNADKVIILDVAINTQAARVTRAGDKERGECIDRLRTQVADSRPVPPFPAPFRKDIMEKLGAAYASGDPNVSVERIIEDAILKNCGP
jgi:hypothetical protein